MSKIDNPTTLAIGSPIGSGTSGSVLFVDSSGNLAQDNANFSYDDSTNTFSALGPVFLGPASSSSLYDGNPLVINTSFGYSFLGYAGNGIFASDHQTVIYDTGETMANFTYGTEAAFYKTIYFPQYNGNGGIFFGENGGTYPGQLSQDASNLYWDVNNKRFGIGTNSPSEALHIYNASTSNALIETGNTGASAAFRFVKPSSVNWSMGAGAADGSNNFNITDAGNVVLKAVQNTGYIGIGNNVTPTDARCEIYASASGTIGLVVRGASAQSAHLQDWRNNSATPLSWVNPGGGLSVAGPTDASAPALHFGYASNTGDIAAATSGSWKDLTIRAGNITMTANTGSLTFVSATGQVGFGTSVFTPSAPLHALYSNTATGGNGLTLEQGSSGDCGIELLITGVRAWHIGIDRSNSNAFMISPNNAADFGANGLVMDTDGGVILTHGTATTIAQIIKGAAAQSANLTEWQNSSGTPGAVVDASRNFSRPNGTSAEQFGSASVASGLQSSAFGNTAIASATNACAIGYGTTASQAAALAVGSGCTASGGGAFAMGNATSSTGARSIAIGDNSSATANDAITMGSGTNANAGSVVLLYGATSTSTGQFVCGSSTYPLLNVFFNQGVVASAPTAWTLNGTGGSGSNIAGGDIQIAGGKGTGNATPGNILFQTSDVGTSGTTLQTLSTKATIGGASVFTTVIGATTSVMPNIGVANVQTSSSGVGNGADTTDDTLFTYSLPTNSMSANGKSVRAIATGHFATNGNTKQVKFWFAGTAVADSGALTLSNTDWVCTIDVVRIDSTHVSAVGRFTGSNVADVVTVTANLSVSDLTANASVIKITGASTLIGTANDVKGYMMRTEFMN